MKLKVSLLINLILLVILFTSQIVFAANPKVQVNGEIIDFTDGEGNKVEAQIINERTMVPLRKIFEVLECKVDWEDATKTVVATKEDRVITLQIGNADAKLKNNTLGEEETIKLDSAPVIVDGRTLVPFRFIGESLGMEVGWDQSSATAIIIDYESFAKIIKNKSDFLYSHGLGNQITIEKKYQDIADEANNYNTKISINENSNVNVNIQISGQSNFATEAQNEEWNDFSYTIDESDSILTSNFAFSKMIGANKNEKSIIDYEKLGLSKDKVVNCKEWVKAIVSIDATKINQNTYKEVQNDFNKLADLFLSTGNKQFKIEDFDFQYIDFNEILSQRMKSNTANALLLLNKALFRYNLNFKDIISDYPSFTYLFSTESNGINVKVTLENDYKEKIEYNFRFSL